MSHKMRMALALSALGLLLVEKEERQRRRRKRIRRNRTKWVQSWILQRQAQAVSPTPCRELEFSETSDFKDFARLFPVQFHTLKELISPLIRRQNTNYRDCISVEERLTVTLRYLATGRHQHFVCCAFEHWKPRYYKPRSYIPMLNVYWLIGKAVFEVWLDWVEITVFPMESGRLDEGAWDLGLKNINAASISEHVVNGDDYCFFRCFFYG